MKEFIRYAGLTNPGRTRPSNEDSWAALAQQGVFVVADGMGAAEHGELAAKLVAETLPPLLIDRFSAFRCASERDLRFVLANCVADFNARLLREATSYGGIRGLGSTVVVAAVRPPLAAVAHLGDSRAYLLRKRRLRRLTNDHTIYQLLADTGSLGNQAVDSASARAHLTRYIGMPGDATPDVRVFVFRPHDSLLLCTDGVTDALTDERIEAIMSKHRGKCHDACEELVDAANAAGGHDNITALLIEGPVPPLCTSNRRAP
jgi:protein phosphatase